MSEIVTIETLGHRGDGVATTPDGPLYVPFALPGERVRIEREGHRARVVEVLDASAERVPPICRHFGECGGCALQMLPLDTTRRLKRDFVVTALRQQGLATSVDATVGVPVSSRRRAMLTALKAKGRVLLGYHERLSHRLVDIEACPVLASELAARLPAIRALLAPLLQEATTGRSARPSRRGGPRSRSDAVRVTALLTRTGLDIDVGGVTAPTPQQVSQLVGLAQTAGLARLSLNGDPLLTLAEPVIGISGVALTPPPGAFLQASAAAEVAMAGLMAEHLAGARRIADLFAGVGTFALALARSATILAVEKDEAALQALSRAARRAQGLKPIETQRRDLFAHPLSPAELARFDAVVLDPPFAGAKAQTEELAGSEVGLVAMVSCNPATFARDARILSEGGLRLQRVVPVDQFVYSAEVEVVGLFRRA